MSQNGNLPQLGVRIKNYLKPPTSTFIFRKFVESSNQHRPSPDGPVIWQEIWVEGWYRIVGGRQLLTCFPAPIGISRTASSIWSCRPHHHGGAWWLVLGRWVGFSSSPSVKCVCKDLENVFKFRNQTNQRLIAPGLILSDSGNPRVSFWGWIYAWSQRKRTLFPRSQNVYTWAAKGFIKPTEKRLVIHKPRSLISRVQLRQEKLGGTLQGTNISHPGEVRKIPVPFLYGIC